jgi:hypothetical protein
MNPKKGRPIGAMQVPKSFKLDMSLKDDWDSLRSKGIKPNTLLNKLLRNYLSKHILGTPRLCVTKTENGYGVQEITTGEYAEITEQELENSLFKLI